MAPGPMLQENAECEFDHGDTAWMLVSIALVFIQTPAVGITQAGMIRRKNTLSMLMQCFTGMIIGAVLWFAVGYSLVFAPTQGLIGDFSHSFFLNVPWDGCVHWANTIPGTIYATYQMVFAMMVPTLVTGAVAEKMTFLSFMLFAVLWPFLVYYPVAHAIWGEGFLAKWGVLDFAGGFVIHLTAGVASFVVSLMIPKRIDVGEIGEQHHNLPLTFVGGCLIWFGWFAFNGGSALGANSAAALAVINTQLSACFGALTWVLCSWWETDMFHLTEVLNGSFAGLAGVTAAAGYIEPWSAALCGIIAGPFSYLTSRYVKSILNVDDVLDVTSLQGTPGFTGAVFGVGLFAQHHVNDLVANSGLIKGNVDLIFKQFVAAVFVTLWTAAGTAICMFIVNRYGVPLSEEEYLLGLDITEQGVSGYDGLSASDLLNKFIEFASKGFESGLSKILKTGFDVNTADYDGRTAIHLASSENQQEVVKFLLDQGASINVKDRWGGTPLSDAIKHGHSQLADFIKLQGGTMVEKSAATELCEAGASGNVEKLKDLIRNDVNINQSDYDGRTSMMLAAAEGHLETVSFLIENGADPNLKDRWGGTALTEAENNRHSEVVKILIASGALVAEKLCRAANRGDFSTIKTLIEQQCDVNLGDYDKRTALHLASANGQVSICKFLLDHRADPNQKDRFDNCAIDDARRHNQLNVLNLLKQYNKFNIRVSSHGSHLDYQSVEPRTLSMDSTSINDHSPSNSISLNKNSDTRKWRLLES